MSAFNIPFDMAALWGAGASDSQVQDFLNMVGSSDTAGQFGKYASQQRSQQNALAWLNGTPISSAPHGGDPSTRGGWVGFRDNSLIPLSEAAALAYLGYTGMGAMGAGGAGSTAGAGANIGNLSGTLGGGGILAGGTGGGIGSLSGTLGGGGILSGYSGAGLGSLEGTLSGGGILGGTAGAAGGLGGLGGLGDILGNIGGSNFGGLLQSLLGLGSGGRGSDAIDAAMRGQDPLSAYRPEFAAMVSNLVAHPESIRQLPGYQFQLDEGRRAIEGSSAARGMLNSGNTLHDLISFGQGLADQTYNKQLGNLSSLASGNPAFAEMAATSNLGRVQGRQNDLGTILGGINTIFGNPSLSDIFDFGSDLFGFG